MEKILFIGFKGKNNTSGMLANLLSSDPLLLTNSFSGLRRDIDSICGEYENVVMFGVDKSLISSVRIERIASLNGVKRVSDINLQKLKDSLIKAGVTTEISEHPTSYLCNDAYWYALEKFSGNAVFIHVPTVKNMNEGITDGIKSVYREILWKR